MDKGLIKIDYDNINVEDIMKQIKRNIQNRNYDKDDLQKLIDNNNDEKIDNSFDIYDLQQNIMLNNLRWNIKKAGPIISSRKIIGPFIIFFKRLLRKITYWYIEFLFDQQKDFNASVTNSINSIDKYIQHNSSNMDKVTEEIFRIKDEFSKIQIRTNDIESNLRGQNYRLDKIENILPMVEKNTFLIDNIKREQVDFEEKILNLKELEERIDKLDENNQAINQINGYSELLKELSILVDNEVQEKGKADSENLKIIYDQIRKNERLFEIVSNRLRRIEHYIKFNDTSDIELKDHINYKDPNFIDMDYFLFETLYRGSRKEIKEYQQIYLNYFKDKKNVADLGCGKGEFLELLVENGVEAIGIELNSDNVAFCTDKGLPVKFGDALEYLSACDDNSLGGIFMAQVIEHLSPQQLIMLVRLARRKLQLGAYFIAETINPQCLMVYIESFYMDLSHTKLVHPLTIKFLTESEGFDEVNFKYLSPVSDEFKIPMLECTECNTQEFNKAITKLNNLMYGYRDYAIIARK